MANDIDSADVPELRRRIVEPVLGTMLRPGELTALTLAIEMRQSDHWNDPRRVDSEPRVWVRIAVGHEQFEQPLCKPGFWLDDPDWIAGELEGGLQEWICESSFGWGQLRSIPDGFVLPGPVPVPGGTRVLSVHFGDDEGQFPLWERGSPVDPDSLAITDSLRADLMGWQARGEELAEMADADAPLPDAPQEGVFGVRIEYVDEAEERVRRIRVEERRGELLERWHAWVGELEPWRDRLVAQLRAELGSGFLILTPPRLPVLS